MESLYKIQRYMEGVSNSLPERYHTKSASNVCKSDLFKPDENTNHFNKECSKFGGFLCAREH